MRKYLLTFVLTAASILMLTGSSVKQSVVIIKPVDLRAEKIEQFLADFCPQSPLRGKGEEMVYCADKFGLDYRLYVSIAGAESTFGKRYIKQTHNLTGIRNGKTPFVSIYDNIYQTNRLIREGKWYKKYRKTNKLEHLVYVYKGVPPYNRYINTLKYIFREVAARDISPKLPSGINLAGRS